MRVGGTTTEGSRDRHELEQLQAKKEVGAAQAKLRVYHEEM